MLWLRLTYGRIRLDSELNMRSHLFISLSAVLFVSFAHAHEVEGVKGYVPRETTHNEKFSPPTQFDFPQDGSRLRKFNLALDTLGIPREQAPNFLGFPDNLEVASSQLAARSKFIDPDRGLARYLNIDLSHNLDSISLYQDFFSSLLPSSFLDFTLKLNSTGTTLDSSELLDHLQAISNQVKDPTNLKPLTGLKIVIDPGHMGSDFWDKETGKYVEVNGVRVSEGEINLQTALLTANEFENLGATVIVTRNQLAPVSPNTYQTFDFKPFQNQYFYNSLDDWMAPYLNLSETELVNTIASKPEVKTGFSAAQKSQLFISGEDLEARSKIIDAQNPDIVIDVHFDAEKSNQLQSTSNKIEAFVPGSFRATETGSRKVRSYALKHLLEMRRWDASVDLATEITQAMAASEKLPLESAPSFLTALRVRDGVYARNLYINRRNLGALMVYLECLHYDHTSEFSALAKKTETGSYHGSTFQYPARLNSIVSGIKTGLLRYFSK